MRILIGLAVAPALLLGACDLAPSYREPLVTVPTRFKESGDWQLARPADGLPHGNWWGEFNDSELDELEDRVDTANPDLAAAVAAYLQARDYVDAATASLFPMVGNEDDFSGNKQSANRPLRGAGEPTYYGANTIQATVSYEVDLWGKLRDTVAAAKAEAQANAADLESVRLSLHAELARDYFSLRGLDRETDLLRSTVAGYRNALALTRQRFQGKIGAPIDVERAESQYETAKAQLADVAGPRALYEHAIATLVGVPASSFSISPRARSGRLPSVPPGVPSELLERRPDVAAAERQTAAANESIGVARAAFFPQLTLNLMAGGQDTGLNLLSLPNSMWSVGPTIYLPLFDAGLRRAQLAANEAAYLQTVAHYRSVVLHAVAEVEDNLASLHALQIEARDVAASAKAAENASNLALSSYRDGATNYLDVIISQTAALDAERTVISVDTRRLQKSVALILALGGGWSREELAIVSRSSGQMAFQK